jgi:hypothetical protein
LVRQWVSYAESNCGPAATKVLGDCHVSGVAYCTALAYLNPNKIYPDSVPIAASAQESWWLHQPGYSDSAHRLYVPDYGGGYFLNQTSSGVRQWYANYAGTKLNGYDGLMMDDTGGGMSAEFWGTGFSSSQEITSNSALLAAHQQMAQSVTHADGTPFLQIDNGISVNPYLPTTFPLLDHPSTVTGLVTEGAPMSNGTQVSFYPSLLDEMAYVDHTPDDFMVLLSYDPSGSLQARRMQAASVLLGYSPGHTVSWSDLETNSGNLAIWPEEGLVPTAPVQSMAQPAGNGCLDGSGNYCTTGGHNDLQVTPGIYRREFTTCYNQATAIGPCAVIVNTTASPATISGSWLSGTYHHQITLQGGDVQTGGTINPTGAGFTAGATTVAAHDAALLAQ